MTEQTLDRRQVASLAVDMCDFGPPHGMHALGLGVQPDGTHAVTQEAGVPEQSELINVDSNGSRSNNRVGEIADVCGLPVRQVDLHTLH